MPVRAFGLPGIPLVTRGFHRPTPARPGILECKQRSSSESRQLAVAVAERDAGLERTIFELQSIDWRTGTAVPATILYEQMRGLQAVGVKHLAYYPDDFVAERPDLEQIRQGISLADYPFRHR